MPLPASSGFGILIGYDDWVFAPETALFTVRDHFKVASLDGFGLKDRTAAIGAVGALLHYLSQHLRRDAANLTRLSFYRRGDFLLLDSTTLRHLEVLESLQQDANRGPTLFGALNRTVTPMGARRLRDWLSQPLASIERITHRQDAVQVMIDDGSRLEQLRAQLGQVRDLERTIGRLSAGTGNGRDLLALRVALEQIPGLKRTLEIFRALAGNGADFGASEVRPIEFPMTLTLSPGERGQQTTAFRFLEQPTGYLCSGGIRNCIRYSKPLSYGQIDCHRFSLPSGEGRGEGEFELTLKLAKTQTLSLP
jgi:DNA mismatch repair protein MutS